MLLVYSSRANNLEAQIALVDIHNHEFKNAFEETDYQEDDDEQLLIP